MRGAYGNSRYTLRTKHNTNEGVYKFGIKKTANAESG
jgi:hypothetical protein